VWIRGVVKALAEMVVERYGPTAVSLTGLNEGVGRNAGATSKVRVRTLSILHIFQDGGSSVRQVGVTCLVCVHVRVGGGAAV
jgi:hypothetical protein